MHTVVDRVVIDFTALTILLYLRIAPTASSALSLSSSACLTRCNNMSSDSAFDAEAATLRFRLSFSASSRASYCPRVHNIRAMHARRKAGSSRHSDIGAAVLLVLRMHGNIFQYLYRRRGLYEKSGHLCASPRRYQVHVFKYKNIQKITIAMCLGATRTRHTQLDACFWASTTVRAST